MIMRQRPPQAGGIEKLKRSAASYTMDLIDQNADEAVGDSPIEKLFFASIVTVSHVKRPEYSHISMCKTEAQRDEFDDRPIDVGPTLYIFKQFEIEQLWRVDFLIHARDYRSERPGQKKWRKLIVECDGHDFHERTKEQASRDRSRDRLAQDLGYQIHRFTGSELWRDPWACAEEVFNWAAWGL